MGEMEYLLPAAYYLVPAICYQLHATYWHYDYWHRHHYYHLASARSTPLFAFYPRLAYSACIDLRSATCYLLPMAYHLLPSACCLLPATYYLLTAT